MFCIERFKLGTATIKVPDGLAIASILLFGYLDLERAPKHATW
jgi:hypothetical protein